MALNMSVAAQRERARNWAISQGYVQNEMPRYEHNTPPYPNMVKALNEGESKPTSGNLEAALETGKPAGTAAASVFAMGPEFLKSITDFSPGASFPKKPTGGKKHASRKNKKSKRKTRKQIKKRK
uniref:Uncharacterized protein n=1 Tax=viral metagenome TaxID=1070528 RepID=A0A6C0DQF7_9ZZZZ